MKRARILAEHAQYCETNRDVKDLMEWHRVYRPLSQQDLAETFDPATLRRHLGVRTTCPMLFEGEPSTDDTGRENWRS